MNKDIIGIVEHCNKRIPLLMIDLDNETIQDHDKMLIAKVGNILNKIIKRSIYLTCNYDSAEYFRLNEITCIKLPYWYTDKKNFIEQIKKIPGDVIQIGGIYQELCVLKVASLIAKHTDKQVIIVNELCVKSSEDIAATAIEFNVVLQWLGEVFMSQNYKKEDSKITINADGKIDLSNIPLQALSAEINRRKVKRIPELIRIINDSISELEDLNCPIIDVQDGNYKLAAVYSEDGKVYFSEVSDD